MQTFTGIEYLKIDIANNFGLDKSTYQERIDWFNTNISFSPESSSTDIIEWIHINQPKEPELFFAGIQAYIKYLNNEPSGYMVSFDATASGIQIMSALTGDYTGMMVTNLIDENNRYDIYSELFEVTKDRFNEIYKEELAISRDNIKSAIMVMMYGGSKSIMNKINDDKRIYDLIMEVCKEFINGAYGIRQCLLKCIDDKTSIYEWTTPDGFHVSNPILVLYLEERYTNVGKIQVKYRDLGTDSFYKGNVANVIHSIDGTIMREVISRCMYNLNQVNKVKGLLELFKDTELFIFDKVIKDIGDSKENTILEELMKLHDETDFVSVRILDYIKDEKDAVNVILTKGVKYTDDLIKLCNTLLQYQPFEVICTHDCFRTHPNNMNYVRYWYNNVLADIAESNSLKFMMSSLPHGSKYFSKLPKATEESVSSIRKANYSLC